MLLLRALLVTAISVLLATSAEGLPMQDGASAEGDIPMHDGRIVGGKDTPIEKYPHQVSLEEKKVHLCGGSLISVKFVVTASHCIYGTEPETLRIRAGTNKRENGGTVVQVDKIAYNENFTITTLDGDVGVLKLQKPLTLSDKIKPIALVPINKEPTAKEILTVTGWGKTYDGVLATILQAVDLPAVSRNLCQRAYERSKITKNMICAGVSTKGSCRGDSGGPVINSKRELVGIVSWGIGCGLGRYPGVFASVASPFIHNFITDFVNSNQ